MAPRSEYEDRFRVLADASSEAVAILDEDGIVEANRSFLVLLGYAREDLLGRPITDVLVEGDRASFAEALRDAWQGTREVEALRQDGETFPAELAVHMLSDEGPTVVAVRDLTMRREEERSMRILRRAMEAATNGIVVTTGRDRDHALEFANPAFLRMIGYEAEEVMGRNCRFLQGPETDPDTVAELREALRADRGAAVVLVNYRKDGTRFWNALSVAPVRDEDGVVRHYVGVMADDTRRVEAEHAVEDLRRRLEERVRERTADLTAAYHELEAFSHSVSHDIRAPLRAVAYHAMALEEDHGHLLPEEARATILKIRDEAQYTTRLVDDLLRLSRATRGELRRRPVDLSRIAEEIVAGIRRADPADRTDFRITPRLTSQADPDLLRVLLENLLSNAQKFSSRGPHPTVEVGVEATEHGMAFFVRDNGAGFDPAEAGRLFEPFRRLRTAEEFEGTGIGLATVRRIVARHGGRVWAEGAPGRGATFRFTLMPGNAHQ